MHERTESRFVAARDGRSGMRIKASNANARRKACDASSARWTGTAGCADCYRADMVLRGNKKHDGRSVACQQRAGTGDKDTAWSGAGCEGLP